MLSNIKNIFKVADLRNKILFTFLIVAIYRVGAAIRVPGVDPLAIDQLREGAQDGALGLFNLFRPAPPGAGRPAGSASIEP